jgi:hypothetical protein
MAFTFTISIYLYHYLYLYHYHSLYLDLYHCLWPGEPGITQGWGNPLLARFRGNPRRRMI